jgi:hypothetical protein
MNASWKLVPALNGSPSMVSIQSATDTSLYLCTYRNDPTQVWADRVNTSNAYDTQRACWRLKKALA